MGSAEVREQVDRIASSPLFASADSLVRLLRAVTAEHLEGRSDGLKEYVLGAEVLGRGPDFDPKTDPIVRMQMGRLRAKLESYYQGDGRQDRVLIGIPKGSYVPVFEERTSQPEPRRMRRRWVPYAALGALLAAAGLFAAHRIRLANHHPAGPVALAVIPFESLSSESENRYYSQGLWDELVARLMKIEGLRIIRWTGKVDDPRELGRRLQVRAIFSGAVRKTGDRVRVTASLADGEEGRRLWSEVYDRDLSDVFTLQDEMVAEIAGALELPLREGSGRRPGTINLKAFELYLEGNYLLNWKDVPTTKRAIAKFQEAIAVDPEYAAAYAGLAVCYNRLIYLDSVPPAEVLPKMKEAAAEALRLDEASAAARLAWAGYLTLIWDFEGEERELQRAIALNPNFAQARLRYGVILSSQGRDEEGFAQGRMAMELEPLSVLGIFTTGVQLMWAGRYPEAIEQLGRAAELASMIPGAHRRLGTALQAQGMHDQALAAFQKAHDLSPEDPALLAFLAHGYGVAGQKEKARKLLARVMAASEHSYVAPLSLARVYLGLGERAHALEWVERAYARPGASSDRFHLLDPLFNSLREEPRFRAVLGKLHLRLQ